VRGEKENAMPQVTEAREAVYEGRVVVLKELDNYDWEEAFGYAGPDGSFGSHDAPEPVPPGSTVSCAAVCREDVKKVIAISDGLRDEVDWLIVAVLKDGRYFALTAGCDYTGWD
jgi:hypothetical protein